MCPYEPLPNAGPEVAPEAEAEPEPADEPGIVPEAGKPCTGRSHRYMCPADPLSDAEPGYNASCARSRHTSSMCRIHATHARAHTNALRSTASTVHACAHLLNAVWSDYYLVAGWIGRCLPHLVLINAIPK